MNDFNFPIVLSDSDLLTETARVAADELRTTARLIALLAEVETRALHLGLGYSSMFVYCVHVLHLSESATYRRITAARLARKFPLLLRLLADGSITLTTVTQLATHLSEENHEALLLAAIHKTKDEVAHLVACIDPQPDFASSVRKLPASKTLDISIAPPGLLSMDAQTAQSTVISREAIRPDSKPVGPRPIVAPLAPDRYLVKITLSETGHDMLQRARDLVRHQIPSGDPAMVVERALAVLVDQLEKSKRAATERPRAAASTISTSRHVPAAVRREVWTRDQGRCAFVGTDGRCRETGRLEFHHVQPFAAGGLTSTDNLQLRCRAHNVYESERHASAC